MMPNLMTAPGSEAAVATAGLAVTPAPSRLTLRELDVLAAMAQAGHRATAASMLGITPSTFRGHLGNAYAKLGVLGAIDAFRALGWLVVPDSPADVRYPTALLEVAERTIEDLQKAASELRERISSTGPRARAAA